MDNNLLSLVTQGAMLGIAAAATPGPLLAFLITQTLSGGWKRGAPVAFAPLLSDLILVPVILLLLKQLNPMALRLLGLGGGIFVLYTSWKLWQSWRKGPEEQLLETRAGLTLRQAVLINFLSPGAYAYWTTVNGPLVINAWKISIGHAVGFIAAFYGFFYRCDAAPGADAPFYPAERPQTGTGFNDFGDYHPGWVWPAVNLPGNSRLANHG